MNLTTDTIQISGIYFEHNDNFKVQDNFLDTVKTYNKCFVFGTVESYR